MFQKIQVVVVLKSVSLREWIFTQKTNILHITDSKGKRSRDIDLTEEQTKNLCTVFQGVSANERLVPIQCQSIQQALYRECIATGTPSLNIHSIRKSYATKQYLSYRSQGYSIKQSLDKVSADLGHGNNRHELMKEYICCPIV